MRYLFKISSTSCRLLSITFLRRSLSVIGIYVFSASGIHALAADSEFLQQRLDARTSLIPVSEMENAAGIINQRLITFIKHGKTYGLAESDVSQIKNIEHPIEPAVAAMRPHMTELYHGLKEGKTAYDLALSLQAAADAEQKVMSDYYVDAVSQLSPEARVILSNELEREMLTAKTTMTDFVGIAEDYPEGAMYMLNTAANNFKQVHGVSTRHKPGDLLFGGTKVIKEEVR